MSSIHSRLCKLGRTNGRLVSLTEVLEIDVSCPVVLVQELFWTLWWIAGNHWWHRWEAGEAPQGVWGSSLWQCHNCSEGNHDLQPKWEIHCGGSLELCDRSGSHNEGHCGAAGRDNQTKRHYEGTSKTKDTSLALVCSSSFAAAHLQQYVSYKGFYIWE